MGKFDRGNKSGGGFKSFGKRDFGGGRGFGASRGPRTMFEATCSECGKQCQIPFRPTGDRPVYCSNCFELKGNTSGDRVQRKTFDKPSFSAFDDKPKFQAECDKCGKMCEVPFRPLPGKKVFCSNCFDKGINAGVKNVGQFNDQFAALNAKLDKILMIMNGSAKEKPADSDIKEVIKKAEKKEKTKTVKKAPTKKVKAKAKK